MRRGFTLLEVLIATIILGLGIAGLLVSMSQAQELMLSATRFQAVQEVMDMGDMAYPLADVENPDMDLDVPETRAAALWDKISKIRLTREQEEKYQGYTWERECLNKNDTDGIARLGGVYVVRVTVRWGDRRRGHGEKESYVTFWRKEAE